MITVTEVAFTGYPITDMKRARAFYEDVLGLKPGHVVDFPNGSSWVEYFIGAQTLAISNMAPDWKPSQDGPSIALEVADYEEAVRVLAEKGVPIVMHSTETPVCHMCVVRDPDDNLVTIHKRKAHA